MNCAATVRTGFGNGTATYKINDGDDFKVDIRAKDFPNAGPNGEFRVYTVWGDVTKPERLQRAVENLLIERGVERRRIIINT